MLRREIGADVGGLEEGVGGGYNSIFMIIICELTAYGGGSVNVGRCSTKMVNVRPGVDFLKR